MDTSIPPYMKTELRRCLNEDTVPASVLEQGSTAAVVHFIRQEAALGSSASLHDLVGILVQVALRRYERSSLVLPDDQDPSLRGRLAWALEWVAYLLCGDDVSAAKGMLSRQGGSRATCGKVWGKGDFAYRCRTCELDPTCAVCVECFMAGDHEGHDYSMIHTDGGCCDCGDPTAWRVSGFCTHHGSALLKDGACQGCKPALPDEMKHTGDAVMSALAREWDLQLATIDEGSSDWVRELSTLSLHLAEWLRELCECNTTMLALVAGHIGNPDVHLLTRLLLGDHRLSGGARAAVHAFLFKLLGDVHFKRQLAHTLIQNYRVLLQDERNSPARIGASREDQPGALLGLLSVQLFTVPTLTPELVREEGLVEVLLECLLEQLQQAETTGKDGRTTLDLSRQVILDRHYVNVGNDLRYTFSHLEVMHYILQSKRGLLELWLKIVTVIQSMNMQRRLTDVHVEHEADTWKNAHILETQLLSAFPLIARALLSEPPTAAGDGREGPGAGADLPVDSDGARRRWLYAQHPCVGRDTPDSTGVQADESGMYAWDPPDGAATTWRAGSYPPPASFSWFLELTCRALAGSLYELLRKPEGAGCVHAQLQVLLGARVGETAADHASVSRCRRASESNLGSGASRSPAHSAERGGSELLNPTAPGGSGTRRSSDVGSSVLQVAHSVGSMLAGAKKRATATLRNSSSPQTGGGAQGPEVGQMQLGSALEQAGEAGQMEDVRVLRAVTKEMDLVKFGVSFNIPLHRILAMLLQAAVQRMQSPIRVILPREFQRASFAAAVLEPLLAIALAVAQVQAGMWIRNGWSMYRVVDLYTYWSEHTSLEVDLFLMQCCAVLLPPEALVTRAEQVFGLRDHFKLNDSPPASEHDPILAEELLKLVMLVVNERACCGLSQEAAVRRELVQRLAVGEATHSALVNAMPRRYTEAVLQKIPKVLEEVAEFRTPSSVTQGQYAMKRECWEEVDLYHPRSGREEMQRVEERFQSIWRTPATTKLIPCWKPAALPMYGLHRLLISARLQDILRGVLFHAVVANERTTARGLVIALHLLLLAVDACCRDADCEDSQILLEHLKLLKPLERVSPAWQAIAAGHKSSQGISTLLLLKHFKAGTEEGTLARILMDRVAKAEQAANNRAPGQAEGKLPAAPDRDSGGAQTAGDDLDDSEAELKHRKRLMRERQLAVMAAMRAQQAAAAATLGMDKEREGGAPEDKEEASGRRSVAPKAGAKGGTSSAALADTLEMQEGKGKQHRELQAEAAADTACSDSEEERSSLETCALCKNHTAESADSAHASSTLGFIVFAQPTGLQELTQRRVATRFRKLPERAEGGAGKQAPHASSKEGAGLLHVPASWEEMDALQEAELERGKAQVGDWGSENIKHTETYSHSEEQDEPDADGQPFSPHPLRNHPLNARSSSAAAQGSDASSFPVDDTKLYISTCRHLVHLDCLERYQSSLILHEMYTFGGPRLVRPEAGEFFCPVCRRLANAVLPIASKSSLSGMDSHPFFGKGRRAMKGRTVTGTAHQKDDIVCEGETGELGKGKRPMETPPASRLEGTSGHSAQAGSLEGGVVDSETADEKLVATFRANMHWEGGHKSRADTSESGSQDPNIGAKRVSTSLPGQVEGEHGRAGSLDMNVLQTENRLMALALEKFALQLHSIEQSSSLAQSSLHFDPARASHQLSAYLSNTLVVVEITSRTTPAALLFPPLGPSSDPSTAVYGPSGTGFLNNVSSRRCPTTSKSDAEPSLREDDAAILERCASSAVPVLPETALSLAVLPPLAALASTARYPSMNTGLDRTHVLCFSHLGGLIFGKRVLGDTEALAEEKSDATLAIESAAESGAKGKDGTLLEKNLVHVLVQMVLFWPDPLPDIATAVQVLYVASLVQGLLGVCRQSGSSPTYRPPAWLVEASTRSRLCRLVCVVMDVQVGPSHKTRTRAECLQFVEREMDSLGHSGGLHPQELVRLHCLGLPFLRSAAVLRNLMAPGSKEGRAVLTQSRLFYASRNAWLQELHDLAISLSQSGSNPRAAQRESEMLAQSFGVPTIESIANLEGATTKWVMHWATALFPHDDLAPGTKLVTMRMVLPREPSCASPFTLIQLPEAYHDLFQRLVGRVCQKCNKVPMHPALCLLCGSLVCLLDTCCQSFVNKRAPVKECFSHAISCGAGTGVYLLLRSSGILCLRGERRCFMSSPYLDQHGEEDENLQRGKPLFLSHERYQQLNLHVQGTFSALSVQQARDGALY